MLTVAGNDAADLEWAGTQADGIAAQYSGETTVGLANGDFSKGFMYWGNSAGDNSLPSAGMKVVTEDNGNSFLF